MLMIGFAASAFAHGGHGQVEVASGATLPAIWLAAFLTAVVHTIMGPDHYLPFVAIAKSRGYGLKKPCCGRLYAVSAILPALF